VPIAILGAASPYHWQVTGEGFSLAATDTDKPTNTLIADPDACGTATIIVTDCMGTPVTGYVLCDEGQWVWFCQDGEADTYPPFWITYYSGPYKITYDIQGAGEHQCRSCGGFTACAEEPHEFCHFILVETWGCP